MKFNQLLLFLFLLLGVPLVKSMEIKGLLNDEDIDPTEEIHLPHFSQLLEYIQAFGMDSIIAIDDDQTHDDQTEDKCNEKAYRCEWLGCNQSFENVFALYDHGSKEHMDPDIHRVRTCLWKNCGKGRSRNGKAYKTRRKCNFLDHFGLHAKFYRFKCIKCNARGSRTLYRSHIQGHCKAKHHDETCFQEIEYVLDNYIVDDENDDKINELRCKCECLGCHKSFQNAKKLYEHMCKKHIEVIFKRLTCSWIGCKCRGKKKDQPFNVENSINGRIALKRHFKTHAQNYTYECTGCDFPVVRMFRKSDMKRHCIVHHEDEECYRKIQYN